MYLLTGMTALIVEQVFEKLLSTILGAGSVSSAIVVSVFFIGMSIGSLSYGRFEKAVKHPIQIFGLAEMLIGSWCILIIIGFESVQTLSLYILSIIESGVLAVMFKVFITAVLLIPSTFLMGLTFPSLFSYVSEGEHTQASYMILYAMNIVGGAIGTILGPYYLFYMYGLRGGLLIVTLIEFIVFVIIYRSLYYSGGWTEAPQIIENLRGKATHDVIKKLKDTWSINKTPVFIAFFSGLIFFSYEILWFHLSGSVVGNSVYSFATTLFVVLLGLGVGSFSMSFISSCFNVRYELFLPSIILLAGLLSSSFMPLWDSAQFFYIKWGGGPISFSEGEFLKILNVIRLILIPSAVLGLIFPSIFRLPNFNSENSAILSGFCIAANSIGSFFGAIISTYVLINYIGSELSYNLLSLMLVLIGFFLILRQYKSFRELRSVTKFFLVLFTFYALANSVSFTRWNKLGLTSGFNVYYRMNHVSENTRLISMQEDSLSGITTVIENRYRKNNEPFNVLLTNGKFQANDSHEMPANIGFSMIPLLYTDDLENVLVIGLGSGLSASVYENAGAKSVDVAELSKPIIEYSKEYFKKANDDLHTSPRVKIYQKDGRSLLYTKEKMFEIISIEISSIWFNGATNLYSEQFYKAAAERLGDTGVMQQWVQLHHLTTKDVNTIISTFREYFKYVNFWYFGGQGVLIGSNSKLVPKHERLERLLSKKEMSWVSDILKKYGHESFSDDKYKVLTSDDVNFLFDYHISQGGVLNNDWNRYLEFSTPRMYLSKQNHVKMNLFFFKKFVENINKQKGK